MMNHLKSLPLSALLVSALILPAAALAETGGDKPCHHGDHKGMSHGKEGKSGQQGCKMHEGMGGSCGKMGMHGLSLPRGIELNDVQQAEVRKLQREMRDQRHEAMGRIMREKDRLDDLMAAETLDARAIGEAHERIFRLRRPLFEAEATAQNRLRALLTPEQRELTRSQGRDACPLHDPRH